MTNEDALEAIELHGSVSHSEKEREIAKIAADAVRKQIPKKFEKVLVFPICPVCNSVDLTPSDKYCKNCGQKLEWW